MGHSDAINCNKLLSVRDVLPKETTSEPSFLVARAIAASACSYKVRSVFQLVWQLPEGQPPAQPRAQRVRASLRLGRSGTSSFLSLTLEGDSSVFLLGHAHAKLRKMMSKIFLNMPQCFSQQQLCDYMLIVVLCGGAAVAFATKAILLQLLHFFLTVKMKISSSLQSVFLPVLEQTAWCVCI